MKKTCHADSVIHHAKGVIRQGWRKLNGLMRLAVLAAVIGLCTAAVFSLAGGKAQSLSSCKHDGTKSAQNDLRSSHACSLINFDHVAKPPVIEQFFGLV